MVIGEILSYKIASCLLRIRLKLLKLLTTQAETFLEHRKKIWNELIRTKLAHQLPF